MAAGGHKNGRQDRKRCGGGWEGEGSKGGEGGAAAAAEAAEAAAAVAAAAAAAANKNLKSPWEGNLFIGDS